MSATSESLDALREAIEAAAETDHEKRMDREALRSDLQDIGRHLDRLAEAVEKQGRDLAEIEHHLRGRKP